MIMTYMEAIRKVITEEMDKNQNLFMIGEDVGPYGGEMGLSKGLWAKYGDDRMRDAPISESAIVGLALGASITGCRAIAEIPFGDFLGIAMDQVYNQAAKMRYMFGGKLNIDLIIRSPLGGYQGGAAQHSQSIEAWFMHAPGLKVVVPSNAVDAMGLLRTALKQHTAVMFFEHKKLYHIKEEVPEEFFEIPFGKASIKQLGKDVTVIATGYMVTMALEAAMHLKKENIFVEVIDPRTLVPLDEVEILKSVEKTGRLVVVNEGWKRGGVASEIAAIVAEKGFQYLKSPIQRVAAVDVPIPFSPVLEKFVLPNTQKIIQAIRAVL
ncbi:MAG: alpha-ketoacid dehydrogenase subunit beta [Bacteroidetes bacterium]|nr:alpha-ketoacid dehydrogenase subunit beta [Bacteroidota bacterium]